ncbi:unnamed protein product [Closterium sp. NIES-64]|nr:unnamed protein product [Closterium sp. NIES-64]
MLIPLRCSSPLLWSAATTFAWLSFRKAVDFSPWPPPLLLDLPPPTLAPSPLPPGDPLTFALNGNDPQSSETAIRTYRTNLQEHLRLRLRYGDNRRIYDDAGARYNKYQEDLDTYTAELADYTTKITAWWVADRHALAILLATIPSSLKRELSPTSSSHMWRLLVDLFDRQDIATLYALIKEFGTLSMDSTSGAAAFTRRVLDLAQRLATLDVVYPDTVICCHLLESLTPAFDAHKLAYMQLISKHHTPAEVAQWIITTEAEILRHSSSTAVAAQSRSSRSGR